MDSKLQQAIIATRAGYNETAQILLTDVLQEHPEDTNAWFLLAHLVDSTERQARYLEYTLFLDPDYTLARQHLERLRKPEVPPPVIKVYSDHGTTSAQKTPPPTVNSEFSPIPPARTNPVLSIASEPDLSTAASPSAYGPDTTEQIRRRIDADWQKTAGPPKRAAQPAPTRPVPTPSTPSPAAVVETAPESDKEPVNKWLLAILFILIAVAVFVIGALVFTIIL